MRNTSLTITVSHLFLPISALRAESRLHFPSLRFKIHEQFKSIYQIILNSKVHLFKTCRRIITFLL
jgi:hypothetical protein